ncbi:response regulator transcription factor [Streptomyces caelestis]|uniref:response regulator transcription factor n=1 Tax=Streptomyces caelestis TaxID=36816 RepID=UPI0028934499|nr:LuxR C-terminal-related transcriptional regulator [Streptomyces caelestis]
MGRWPRRSPLPLSPPPEGLTPRECEALALVGEGLSNREIGEVLYLGVTTVKSHAAALMTKTGLPNRIRLAVLAATHR